MPSERTLMFAGFRSRWTIPCSCAASSASAICLAMAVLHRAGSRRAQCAAQVGPFDEFHDQRRDAAALFESVDARDVWMIQRGQGLGFARESRQAIGDHVRTLRAGS